MYTILVPTDFSATAKNAARYAIEFAKQTGSKKIILYNVYQQAEIAEPMSGTPVFYDLDDFKKISEEGLAKFKLQLQAFCPVNIQLETISEYNLLSTGVDELCKSAGADIVIMGITEVSGAEEVLVGSNSVNISKHTPVPVIIVPEKAAFTPVEEVVLACDFKQVVESIPIEPLKKLLDITRAKLFVLNIDHNNKRYNSETPFESLLLDTLLQNYQREYHFIDSEDYIAAINQFVTDKQVDIVVTIPKKHGWFDSLFKRSHTKQLAYHSHVPILVIHD